jgi:X-X-X-Leu-X-X-Gly heptad repeat protein
MNARSNAAAGVCALALVACCALPQVAAGSPSYAQETSGGAENSSAASEAGQTTTGALLEGSAEKQEVVYASMSATGAPKSIYVVNELFSDTPALLKDYGAYTETINLTNEASLATEPDSVVCEVEDSSFVYQGNLASTDLPWLVDIRYMLDGKEVLPESLAGASGQLEITINTSENAALDSTYFENYLLQITCTLPMDNATNIKTEDGSIALSGSDTTVTFSAMPGKTGSYSLTAQVKDFEMEGISFAAIPFSMVIDAPNTEALVSQFDALIEGSDALDSGAQSLEAGATQLQSGTQALDSGVAQLQEGSSSLSSGVASYVEGVAQLSMAMAKATEGSNTFAEKLDELSQTSESVVQGLSGAEAQFAALSQTIQQSSMTDAEKQAILQQLSGMSGQFSSLKDYANGVASLADAYQPLNSSLAQISDGLSTLSEQGKTLADGSAELSSGASTLAASTSSLASGTSALASGAQSLAQGTAQLSEESKGIPTKVQAEIDSLMASYDKSSFTPTSFVDSRNTGVNLVQFVMTTEAISVPEVEVEEPQTEDETFLSRFLALFS